MEPGLTVVAVALAVALAALAAVGFIVAMHWTGWRRADRAGSATDASLIVDTLAELRAAQAQAIAELRADVHRSLGETEQQVLTQSGTTQRALSDLARELNEVGLQSARVGDLARDIGSLHDLLRAPKLRGGFGELLMERLLEDSLPGGSFQLQYTYRSGARVDGVVHFAGRLVPIDAKFPIEAFRALAASADDNERRSRRRFFVQQVKRHVDSVARYISPEDGTIDYAFMYLPAEQVFYEILRDEDLEIHGYCAQRHVIPTSPNTLLAYLQLVSLGLRGLAMQERTRELHAGIRHAAVELDRFRALHDQLGRHLENAGKKFAESGRGLDRATDAVAALVSAPAGDGRGVPLEPVLERLFEEPISEVPDR